MPSYTYRDENGHEMTMVTTMIDRPEEVVCHCGLEMYRKFHPANTNWGGLRPGQERSPEIQNLLDTKDERRDAFDEEHEKHERNNT